MEVYIEYVIIDNFVITGLIAAFSYRVLKAKASKPRILFASTIGTIAAVFYPFMNFHALILFIIKLGVYFTLSTILFFKKPYFFKGAIAFLLVTIALGGAMFMAGFLFFGDALSALTLPFYNFSIGLILLIPIILYAVLRRIISSLNKHRNIFELTYKIEFSVFDQSFNAYAFLDTGNLLIDEKSGLPVVILGLNLTTRILNPFEIDRLISGKTDLRKMNAATLKNSAQIFVVKPQKFRLYFSNGKNTLKEVMLGLSLIRLKGGVEALLSLDIIN